MINNEEYELQDPSRYVTKVINQENAVKKKLMANELSSALKEQMAIKKLRKEEEKKKKIADDIKYEEKFKRQEEALEAERRRLIGKGRNNLESKDLEEMARVNERAQQEQRVEQLEEMPIEPYQQIIQQANEPPQDVNWTDKYLAERHIDHALDMQLKQLQNEMLDREKAFSSELERLKQVASSSKSNREEAERKLTMLKDHIMHKPENSETYSYKSDAKFGIHPFRTTFEKTLNTEKRESIGRFSKLYFTDYNKSMLSSTKGLANEENFSSTSAKKKYHPKFNSEDILFGDSQMIPWRPRQGNMPILGSSIKAAQDIIMKQAHDKESYSKNISKIKVNTKEPQPKYDLLDELMKEFLAIEKPEKGSGKKEDIDKEIDKDADKDIELDSSQKFENTYQQPSTNPPPQPMQEDLSNNKDEKKEENSADLSREDEEK